MRFSYSLLGILTIYFCLVLTGCTSDKNNAAKPIVNNYDRILDSLSIDEKHYFEFNNDTIWQHLTIAIISIDSINSNYSSDKAAFKYVKIDLTDGDSLVVGGIIPSGYISDIFGTAPDGKFIRYYGGWILIDSIQYSIELSDVGFEDVEFISAQIFVLNTNTREQDHRYRSNTLTAIKK